MVIRAVRTVAATTAAAVPVAISALVLVDSPRLSGEDTAHTRRLTEVEEKLPPILVHRGTMRVIDGYHRVRAAMLKGETKIEATFYDGSEDMVFPLAVEQNVAHGLPLSLADRRSAAERIVATFPEWADRAIASSTGLSPKTVAAIRRRSGEENPRLNTRLGRDGRAHPLCVADGRRRAAELITEKPDASLREIAREAGISPGTVQDVRARLKSGQDPVLPMRRSTTVLQSIELPPIDHSRYLEVLKNDPSLRFTHEGRNLLRWLHVQVLGTARWADMIDTVPAHSADTVAALATYCSSSWREFSRRLNQLHD